MKPIGNHKIHIEMPMLKQNNDGIYYAAESGVISYPEEGNEACFELEDRSFWFRHRNARITHFPHAFITIGDNVRIGSEVEFFGAGHDHSKINLPNTAESIKV